MRSPVLIVICISAVLLSISCKTRERENTQSFSSQPQDALSSEAATALPQESKTTVPSLSHSQSTIHSLSVSNSQLPMPKEAIPLLADAESIQRARAVIGKSPSEAIQLLDEHRKVYPQSPFAFERELLLAYAIHKSGKTEEAKAKAKSLLRQSHSRPERRRIKLWLQSMDELP